ncbi:MAG: radical SAM protein [Candidatus Omnitrophica bacterium]|nr:radical SAM protein [Candidatus Omnitrophota bacterium]
MRRCVHILKHLSRTYGQKISYMLFGVTARCDAFCRHCWNWRRVEGAGKFNKDQRKSLRDELTVDEIKKISSNLAPILLLNLCGGEPFIRAELPEIVRIFRLQNDVSYFSIPTNGFATERIVSSIEIMCKENPDAFFRIPISFDGFGKDHDRIRSYKNGFEAAMRTAKELSRLNKKYRNFSVGAGVLFSSQTQSNIDEFLDHLHSLDLFDMIGIMLVRGFLMDSSLKDVDMGIYQKATRKLLKYRYGARAHPFSPIHMALQESTFDAVARSKGSDKREFKCYAGQKFITIDDIGDVFACEMLEDKKLGSLRDFDYDINELLYTDKAKEVIRFIKRKECHCTWECAINMSWIFDPLQAGPVFIKSFKYI